MLVKMPAMLYQLTTVRMLTGFLAAFGITTESNNGELDIQNVRRR
jgi:hypothetical protein